MRSIVIGAICGAISGVISAVLDHDFVTQMILCFVITVPVIFIDNTCFRG